jgi:hypothetical protein
MIYARGNSVKNKLDLQVTRPVAKQNDTPAAKLLREYFEAYETGGTEALKAVLAKQERLAQAEKVCVDVEPPPPHLS